MYLVLFSRGSSGCYLPWNVKRLFLVLFLCLSVLAQSAALAAQQREHRGTDHCCLRCHTGPQPALQSIVSVGIDPAFHVVWLAPAASACEGLARPAHAKSSRAPPAA